MKMIRGKITEIYLPEEYIDGKLVDEIYRQRIGFKIFDGKNHYKIEMKQDNDNCKLFRDDIVEIYTENNKIAKIKKVG